MRSWLTSRRADQLDAASTGRSGEHTSAPEDWAGRLGLIMLLIGAACRLHVYLLGFPIWRDEASLALNLVSRDFCGLLHELDNFQIAPLLFLWLEKAVYQFLGGSVYLLRLLPLLAGIGGLLLFWRLARLSLSPLAAALAVGFLAVAQSPIHLAAMVKPYSFDLFTAALLLTLAVSYLQHPEQSRHLIALALVIPFTLVSSYPAIFVAGAVSLTLLPVVWKRSGLAGRCWFVAFNLLCGATFAAHLRFVGREGHDPTLPSVQDYMTGFWNDGFLPHEPLSALRWLWRCHTGHMLSYPLVFNGGGLLGLLLAAAGVRVLWRQRQRALLALCLLPPALNFAAAVLHRYPYAGDQRLEQHLAPGLCLLLGSGLAELIRRLPARRRLVTVVLASLLFLIGLLGAIGDAWHPYQDVEAAWAEDIAHHLHREVRSQDRIVFPHTDRFTLNCLRWQLLPFGRQVGTITELDWPRLERGGGRLWFVDQMVRQAPADREPSPRDPRELSPYLGRDAWYPVRCTRFLVRQTNPGALQVFHYCCDLHILKRGVSSMGGAGDG